MKRTNHPPFIPPHSRSPQPHQQPQPPDPTDRSSPAAEADRHHTSRNSAGSHLTLTVAPSGSFATRTPPARVAVGSALAPSSFSASLPQQRHQQQQRAGSPLSASAGPSTAPLSGSSSTWHLDRARRLRTNHTASVMGAKLSRRESHTASASGSGSSSSSCSTLGRRRSHDRDRDRDRSGPTAARAHEHHHRSAPSHSAVGGAVSTSQSQSGTPSLSSSRPAPEHVSAPASAPAALALDIGSPQAGSSRPPQYPAAATVPALAPVSSSVTGTAAAAPSSFSSSSSAAASPSHHSSHLPTPSSPITSASPTARRIKSHFAMHNRNSSGPGGYNHYALPASALSVVTTLSPSADSPADQGAVAPVTQHNHALFSPLPNSAHGASTSAPSSASPASNHEEQEAILFSPAYYLPPSEVGAPGGGAGAYGDATAGQHASVSVNSMQETVAAQSALVQTAVATGHVATSSVAAAASAAARRNAAVSPPSKPGAGASTAATPVVEDEFDPFLFIKHLPPLSQAIRTCIAPVLPERHPSAPRLSLALDLDETLVHCSVEPLSKHDLTFNVNFNAQDYVVYVKLRPHLYTFLRTVRSWYEVIVFTASQRIYADKLLNILDAGGDLIAHRVFRDSCVCVEGNFLKDLTVLGRPLSRTVIIDNSVQAFGFQLDNGVPIESWFGEKEEEENDTELLKLLPFLDHLRHQADVRPTLKQTFKLSEFVRSL